MAKDIIKTRAYVKKIEGLGDLTPDPANARRHNPRNVGMIEDSLHEVGAARSIVIDENGVILAGNATVEAAGNAGIERVQVVEADGNTIIAVRRTGLTADQKRRLALFDNQTAALADWDTSVLSAMLEQDKDSLKGLFEDSEIDALCVAGVRQDRTLEEIDLDMLPDNPVWCLLAIPVDRLPEVKGKLDEIEALGIRCEYSDR
jgi:hypothetical protein